MASYLVDSFAGGLADYEKKGVAGSFKFASNGNIRQEYRDTFSCRQALEEEGLHSSSSPSRSTSPSLSISSSPSLSASRSVSPTPSPSASASPSSSRSASPSPTGSASPSLSPSVSFPITSVFRDLIRWFVKASDGYTYGFGHTGYIYRRDLSGFWQRVYKEPDGEIKGAAEWYNSGGKTYLYWATNTKLHRKELPGLSNWNDADADNGSDVWPKQNLSPATWHSMRECGGSLIIANGKNLALVGYDDSYTNNALDLIPGNVATTIVERNGRTIVGTARASNETRGINAAIDTEVALAQVGDNGELFFADMVNSVSVRKFPGGGKCNPGGVTNEIEQVNFFEWEQTALSWIDKHAVGNMALFAVYGAEEGKNGVYSFGRYNKNKPFVMNLDHQIEADELGAITVVDDGTMLVSYKDGSDYGVKATDPNNKATADYYGLDFRAPNKKPAQITNWQYTEMFLDPLPSGCGVEFYYKLNKSTDWIQARTADGQNRFTRADAQKVVFNIASDGKVFEHWVRLIPYGNETPEIHWIETFFT